MERLWPNLRAASLLGAGSMLVHELRYVAGYRGDAGTALTAQGHSYMPWAESVAIVLLAATLARFLVTLARARRGHAEARPAPRFVRAWLSSAVALAAVYTTQEALEGTFAPGHPSGVVGVLGHGGWTALLFSVLIAALIAGVTRLAFFAVDRLSARAIRAARLDERRPPLVETFRARRLDVLAWNLAGRAPPSASIGQG